MIERVMDKRRILELYLNVIEWGDGVFGAEAAARHYFGTSAATLAAEPSARLAAMVPPHQSVRPPTLSEQPMVASGTAHVRDATTVEWGRLSSGLWAFMISMASSHQSP